MIVFETERLLVRQFTAADLDGLYLLSSDPVVMQHIRPVITREAAENLLADEMNGYKKHPQSGRFAIEEKSSGKYIGNFLVRPSSFMGGTEVGYALLQPAWGKGYATELTRKSLPFVFEELQQERIYAITARENEGSKKVLLKCGFVQQPDFRDDGREKCLFDITRTEQRVFTKRLQIIPLSYKQLLTYLQAGNLLEAELGLAQTNRNVSAAVKDMVGKFTLPQIKNAGPQHFLFYTFWIVVEKSSGVIVAELGFKGPPNANKAVEIGYGTMPGKENNGYMTEAVGGMLEWAKKRKDISLVLASIDKNNIASIRIVQKNNFEWLDQQEEMGWWKKEVSGD